MPDVLTELPPGAEAGAALAALGDSGELTRLYGSEPDGTLDPVVLRGLLGDAHARLRPGVVLSLLVHLASAAPLLAEHGRTATGLVALAATDTNSGSDLTALSTAVEIGPDTVVLDGAKRWVTSATTAGHALVLARHRPGRHFTNFTWVLVPLNAPGVTVRASDTTMFAGSGVGHVDFSSVSLGRSALVGRPGRALAVFARHMAVERLGSAAWAIELCRKAIADTARALELRTVGDEPLRHAPLVRHRLAECAVRVSALHGLWTTSCRRIAVDRDTTAAAVLKAASSAVVDRVLGECAHLQGADGFASGGVQQLRAEAAVFGIGGGTTEVVLGNVADRLDVVLNGLAS
ncbi:citronellyl-CoA dehydrogenase [Lentzea aerocolonigenes]|nr:citronellyl-CoA dehydrogenase [Lentzea aerocolonigenes]